MSVYSGPQVAKNDLVVVGVILAKIGSLFQIVDGVNQLLKRAIDGGQSFILCGLHFVCFVGFAHVVNQSDLCYSITRF